MKAGSVGIDGRLRLDLAAIHSQAVFDAGQARVEVPYAMEHFAVVFVHICVDDSHLGAEGFFYVCQAGVVYQDADEDDDHRWDRGQRYGEELSLRHVVSVADVAGRRCGRRLLRPGFVRWAGRSC